MYPLETWLVAWWPTKALSQATWPLSFQETCYTMSQYASKVTNAEYYWKSLAFPFELITHSQTMLLSICFLLIIPTGPPYVWFFLSSITFIIKNCLSLLHSFLKNGSWIGCLRTHTGIYDTSFPSYSFVFFLFFSSLIPKGDFSIPFHSFLISFRRLRCSKDTVRSFAFFNINKQI